MDRTAVRIAQISDTHLLANASHALMGINTENSLHAVLTHIEENFLPDLALLTGDLSQDGSASSYQRLEQHIQNLSRPAYWLPGNHDEFHIAHSVFENSAISNDKFICIQKWQIILLNSQKPGAVEGYLTNTELDFLEARLQEYPNHHTLLCLHHHPLPIGSAYLDAMGLQNASDFLSIIDSYSNIRGVICGHVHQASEIQRKGIPFLSAPSTNVQFKPHSEMFAVDTCAPGYRWLELGTDGMIKTGIHRIQN